MFRISVFKLVACKPVRKRTAVLLYSNIVLLGSCCSPALSEPPTSKPSDQSPQAVLKNAVEDFKSGKVDAAIKEVDELLGSLDDSSVMADYAMQSGKADLAVFNLKAGHPDESARLIRELLLMTQLDSHIAPEFSKNPSVVYADARKVLKESFRDILERLGEGADTKAIFDSLIDNTVPKDYDSQLKKYCNDLKKSSEVMLELQAGFTREELKYLDALSNFDADETNKADARYSRASLEKLGANFDALAVRASQLPVGDAMPALYIYQVAVAANSVGQYDLAEELAKKSIGHLKALPERIAGLSSVYIALAYSYAKQGKTAELKGLKEEVLKSEDRELSFVAFARFLDATGDGAGALELYKLAMAARAKKGQSGSPEWQDLYNEQLKKSEAPESPRHDIFQNGKSEQ